jgi:short-subunit dehydrogenase
LDSDLWNSKSALDAFTESFAKEMNPNWNIYLMVVAPGGIQTSFGSNVQFTIRHPDYNTPASPLNQLLSYMADAEVQKTFATPDSCARTVFDVVVGQHQRPLPRRLLIGAETIPLMEADINNRNMPK